MSSMAGLVGPAIVEERGAGGCGGFSSRSVGVYSGGGTNDAFAGVPLRDSPTSSAACKSLA